MEEYYVGWGTLALINANLGQLKGLNGAVIFFFSIVFGPLVTLFLIGENPNKNKEKNEKETEK